MKKHFVIAALLLAGLGFSFTSCGDDEPAPKTNYSSKDKETGGTSGTETGEGNKFGYLEDLHVEGRYLKNGNGETVNLHGFAQTYSSWFNEMGKYWSGNDLNGCMTYNKRMIDGIVKAGWHMTWMRLHMDPQWTTKPGYAKSKYNGSDEADIGGFDEALFKKYLSELYIPMAEYAINHGMVVVMRPPGVCPHILATSDHWEDTKKIPWTVGGVTKTYLSQDYHSYLLKIWDIVSSNARLKNNPMIQFELANEPVYIWDPEAKDYGPRWVDKEGWHESDGMYKIQTEIFQSVVDVIRDNGCNNVIWVPSMAYQGNYTGYVKYPIVDDNYGFAVHCYPGWFDSDGSNGDGGKGAGSYDKFKASFDTKVGCVAKAHPVIITENDWARTEFDHNHGGLGTWGTGFTGEAGEWGYGANFKKIMDSYGNISWLTFVWEHFLAAFDPTHPEDGGADGIGMYDYESGVYPVYQWFNEYWEQDHPGE